MLRFDGLGVSRRLVRCHVAVRRPKPLGRSRSVDSRVRVGGIEHQLSVDRLWSECIWGRGAADRELPPHRNDTRARRRRCGTGILQRDNLVRGDSRRQPRAPGSCDRTLNTGQNHQLSLRPPRRFCGRNLVPVSGYPLLGVLRSTVIELGCTVTVTVSSRGFPPASALAASALASCCHARHSAGPDHEVSRVTLPSTVDASQPAAVRTDADGDTDVPGRQHRLERSACLGLRRAGWPRWPRWYWWGHGRRDRSRRCAPAWSWQISGSRS